MYIWRNCQNCQWILEIVTHKTHKNQYPSPVLNFSFTEPQYSDKCLSNLPLKCLIFNMVQNNFLRGYINIYGTQRVILFKLRLLNRYVYVQNWNFVVTFCSLLSLWKIRIIFFNSGLPGTAQRYNHHIDRPAVVVDSPDPETDFNM